MQFADEFHDITEDNQWLQPCKDSGSLNYMLISVRFLLHVASLCFREFQKVYMQMPKMNCWTHVEHN